jgi:hypothetical protein
MGEAVAAAVASKVVGSVLDKAMGGGKSAGKAQAQEAARLKGEADSLKAEQEAKRKARAMQRPQTNVFGTQAPSASGQLSGALGA